MTVDEFLSELEEARGQFEWALQPGPGSGSGAGLCLRATLRGVPSAVFDPLAAVSYIHTGRLIEATSWTDAARTLDMKPSTAARVMAAANDLTGSKRTGRNAAPDVAALRERLLRVAGVEEISVGNRAAPGPPPEAPPAGHRRNGVAEPAPERTRRPGVKAVRSQARALRGRFLHAARTLVRSVGIGVLAVLTSTLLYLSTVLYFRALSMLVERYGGPPVADLAVLLGRGSTLWLIGLFIFAVTLCRARHPTSP